MMRQGWIKRLISIVLPVMISLVCFSQTVLGDWLNISGEKGFYFNYASQSSWDNLNYWGTGFSFSQSLVLDLQGEFGNGYLLEGHLVDLPDAPTQLFLDITGQNAGLRFGDGNLQSFSTEISPWTGEFNGLTAYLKKQQHQLNMAVANPTGVAVREELTIQSGHNYGYVTYQPIREGSLKVFRGNTLLEEEIDYVVDYFTGKIELLQYPNQDLRLILDYQYSLSEILGNQFVAFSEKSVWDRYSLGVQYFGSKARSNNNPVLLGEIKQPAFFDLTGINFGFKVADWDWEMEYWASQEQGKRMGWDYLDNMEGEELESEVFPRSTDPLNWFSSSSGSGIIHLSGEAYYSKDGQSYLVLDYQLQRTGDSVSVYHDFGSYRDFSMLESIKFNVYGGTNTRLEVQAVTSENNYYFYLCDLPVNNTITIPINQLSTMGIPDLKKIRYFKFVITSPTGVELAQQLQLGSIKLISKTQAEQRWSLTDSDGMSSISVSSGFEDPNHFLIIDYTLTAADGWVSAAYQPMVVMDISNYRYLRMNFKSTQPVKLTVLATRSGIQYSLGELTVNTGGVWQEYSLPLQNNPIRVLERVEQLVLKLSESSIGTHRIEVDDLRVTERMQQNSGAVKARGDYKSGPWQSQVQINQIQPGFRDLAKTYHYQNQNIRNITEYTTSKWRIKSDLQMYNQADPTYGYPLDGQEYGFEVKDENTMLRLTRSTETTEIDTGNNGLQQTTKLSLNQQWNVWNFGWERQWLSNSVLNAALDLSESDLITVKYQKDFWWGLAQVWQNQNDTGSNLISQYGANYSLGFNPPGANRFQINGGLAEAVEPVGDTSSYFLQSDWTYLVNNWLTVNGMLKTSENPQGDREGLISDWVENLNLKLTPWTGLQLNIDQKQRNWDEVDTGAFAQNILDYRLFYDWSLQNKVSFFYRKESLTALSGNTNGSRFGILTDMVISASWLTQISVEINTNSGQNPFITSDQSAYKFNVKNSIRRSEQVFYWGAWAEGSDTTEEWERAMLQIGWEKPFRTVWKYGLKLDGGGETINSETGFAWGTAGFVALNQAPHFLQVNMNYQTYLDNLWKIVIEYRYLKGDAFSFNLHGDFLYNLTTGHNIIFRADLLFYLR